MTLSMSSVSLGTFVQLLHPVLVTTKLSSIRTPPNPRNFLSMVSKFMHFLTFSAHVDVVYERVDEVAPGFDRHDVIFLERFRGSTGFQAWF